MPGAMLGAFYILSHLVFLQIKKRKIRKIDMWLIDGIQGMNTGLPDTDHPLGLLDTTRFFLQKAAHSIRIAGKLLSICL